MELCCTGLTSYQHVRSRNKAEQYLATRTSQAAPQRQDSNLDFHPRERVTRATNYTTSGFGAYRFPSLAVRAPNGFEPLSLAQVASALPLSYMGRW